MENRVALIGIIVSEATAVESVNSLLHEYRDHIVGRMGLPIRERGISLISVALDGPQDIISALSGKLGALSGVSTKTVTPRLDV